MRLMVPSDVGAGKDETLKVESQETIATTITGRF